MADITTTTITKMELDTKDVEKKLKKAEKGQKDLGKATKDTSGALDGMTGQLDKMTGGALSSVKGLGNMVKGFRSLKVAIAATGIGALLLAFSSLVAFFKSSEEGQDKLNKIMGVFGVIVGNISDLVANFGGAIIEAFENPKETIRQLGEFIKTQITNRIQALGKIGSAIAKIFSKDWKQGFKDLGNAGVQAFTGVEDAVQKAKDGVAGFLKETRDEVKESQRVSDLRAKTDRLEREQLVRRSALEAEIAENRLKSRQDDQFTAAERVAFLNEAQRLSDQLLATDQEIARNRLEEQQITNSFSKSTKENKDAEAQAEANLNNITTRRLNEQRALERELFRVRKQLKEEEAQEDIQRQIDSSEAVLAGVEDFEEKRTDIIVNAREVLAGKIAATAKAQADAEEEEAKRLADAKETAEEDLAKSINSIRGRVAGLSKETALFDVVISTAQSIAKTFGTLGWPLGIPAALGAAAAGAVQAAVISSSSAPSSFAKGGRIGGKLHSSGGTMIEAERGEAIINRKSMANPALRGMASKINVAGGGVAFAQQGMLVGGQSAAASIRSLSGEIEGTARRNRSILVTEDLNIVQDRVLITEEIATL